MKVIKNIKEIRALNKDLSEFIISCSPWLTGDWNPEEIGFIFILNSQDINESTSINITPHISINLATYDLWETPSIFDPNSNYLNLVAIIGQEFGCSLFLSHKFMNSIPGLRIRAEKIQGELPNVEHTK